MAYLIYSIGPLTILEVLKDVNPTYFTLAFLLSILGVVLSSKKLQILLKGKKEDLDILTVVKYYYIGKFFNSFLPSTIGGDVVKANKISKKIMKPMEAYSSVFMERYTGLIALIGLSIISSLLYIKNLPEDVLILIYLVFLPSIVFLAILITNKATMKRFRFIYKHFLRLPILANPKDKIERLYDSINCYKENKKEVIYAILFSFLFHITVIIQNLFLAHSLGVSAPLYYFFIFIPICTILLFIPISIRGLGMREVLYVHFFTQIGVGSEEAFSMSFLMQILITIGSSIGGIFYLTDSLSGDN